MWIRDVLLRNTFIHSSDFSHVIYRGIFLKKIVMFLGVLLAELILIIDKLISLVRVKIVINVYEVDFELLGEIKPHNLKPDGADIMVNEENKVGAD